MAWSISPGSAVHDPDGSPDQRGNRGAGWSEIDMAAGACGPCQTVQNEGSAENIVFHCPRRPPRCSESALPLRKDGASLIFPSPSKRNAPLSDMTLTAVLRRMRRDGLTVHGFRSTFRDWCAEATGYPGEAAEMALAHIVGDKVEAAYRRGDLIDKRRRLMEDWAAHCERPSLPADIVPLKGITGPGTGAPTIATYGADTSRPSVRISAPGCRQPLRGIALGRRNMQSKSPRGRPKKLGLPPRASTSRTAVYPMFVLTIWRQWLMQLEFP